MDVENLQSKISPKRKDPNFSRRIRVKKKPKVEFTKNPSSDDAVQMSEISSCNRCGFSATSKTKVMTHYFKIHKDKSIKDKSIEDKSIEDKSIEDKSIEDKSIEDKSIKDKSIEDKSIEDKLIEDRSIEDRSIEDKSIQDKSIQDKSIQDKSIQDKSIQDKSIQDKSIEDKSIEDRSIEDRSIEERFIVDRSIEDIFIEDNSIEERFIVDKLIEDNSIEDSTIEDRSFEDRLIVDKSTEDRSIVDKSIEDSTIDDKSKTLFLKVIDCKFCDFSSTSKTNVLTHYSEIHKDKWIEDRSKVLVLNCPDCCFSTDCERRLEAHIRFCLRIIEAKKFDFAVLASNQNVLQENLESENQIIEGPLNSANEQVSQTCVEKRTKKYACHLCSFKTNFVRKLKLHKSKKHSGSNHLKKKKVLKQLPISNDSHNENLEISEKTEFEESTERAMINEDLFVQKNDNLDFSLENGNFQDCNSNESLSNTDNDEIKTLHCSICRFETTLLAKFESHWNIHHPGISELDLNENLEQKESAIENQFKTKSQDNTKYDVGKDDSTVFTIPEKVGKVKETDFSRVCRHCPFQPKYLGKLLKHLTFDCDQKNFNSEKQIEIENQEINLSLSEKRTILRLSKSLSKPKNNIHKCIICNFETEELKSFFIHLIKIHSTKVNQETLKEKGKPKAKKNEMKRETDFSEMPEKQPNQISVNNKHNISDSQNDDFAKQELISNLQIEMKGFEDTQQNQNEESRNNESANIQNISSIVPDYSGKQYLSQQVVIQCSKCNFQTRTKSEMAKHFKQCFLIPGQTNSNKSEPENHLTESQLDNSKKLKSENQMTESLSVFSTKLKTENHLTQSDQLNMKTCARCGFRCHSGRDLALHFMTCSKTQNNNNSTPRKSFLSPSKTVSVENKAKLLKEQQMSPKRLLCSKCDQVLPNRQSYSIHVKTCLGSTALKVETKSSEISSAKLSDTSSPSQKTSDRSFVCSKSNFESSSVNDQVRHMKVCSTKIRKSHKMGKQTCKKERRNLSQTKVQNKVNENHAMITSMTDDKETKDNKLNKTENQSNETEKESIETKMESTETENKLNETESKSNATEKESNATENLKKTTFEGNNQDNLGTETKIETTIPEPKIGEIMMKEESSTLSGGSTMNKEVPGTETANRNPHQQLSGEEINQDDNSILMSEVYGTEIANWNTHQDLSFEESNQDDGNIEMTKEVFGTEMGNSKSYQDVSVEESIQDDNNIPMTEEVFGTEMGNSKSYQELSVEGDDNNIPMSESQSVPTDSWQTDESEPSMDFSLDESESNLKDPIGDENTIKHEAGFMKVDVTRDLSQENNKNLKPEVKDCEDEDEESNEDSKYENFNDQIKINNSVRNNSNFQLDDDSTQMEVESSKSSNIKIQENNETSKEEPKTTLELDLSTMSRQNSNLSISRGFFQCSKCNFNAAKMSDLALHYKSCSQNTESTVKTEKLLESEKTDSTEKTEKLREGESKRNHFSEVTIFSQNSSFENENDSKETTQVPKEANHQSKFSSVEMSLNNENQSLVDSDLSDDKSEIISAGKSQLNLFEISDKTEDHSNDKSEIKFDRDYKNLTQNYKKLSENLNQDDNKTEVKLDYDDKKMKLNQEKSTESVKDKTFQCCLCPFVTQNIVNLAKHFKICNEQQSLRNV
jgi:hypothetical protein